MPDKQEERKSYNPLLKNYPFSVKINKVSEGAETLYTRLLAQSDDYGNYDANPRLVLAQLYSKRWDKREVSEQKIGKRIDELESVNLVVRYEVDGDIYLHLVGCFKTLRSDVKRDVRYPTFLPELVIDKGHPEHGTNTGRTRPPNQTRLDQTRLDQYVHLFDKFWKKYPRKDAKQRAVAWFEKNKPSEDDVYKMIFTIEKQSRFGQRLKCRERKHIPLPCTWLNDRDWEDAPTKAELEKAEARIAEEDAKSKARNEVADKARREAEEKALEEKRKEIRAKEGQKFREMKTEKLQAILDNHISPLWITRAWLIKEILDERAKQ